MAERIAEWLAQHEDAEVGMVAATAHQLAQNLVVECSTDALAGVAGANV